MAGGEGEVMADFTPAFDKTMEAEGGYVLHHVPGDNGGITYAGISRRFNPQWDGWRFIDTKDFDNAKDLVQRFYRENYWGKIKGEFIHSQDVADTVYDFAVNAGVKRASILAQIASRSHPDGWIGEKTLEAINNMDEELFVIRYTIARIARRVEIVKRDRRQGKFFLGWIIRDLQGIL